MLKKKEYTAILALAKSREEIIALFSTLYSPQPAIRIVRRNYKRYDDKDYFLSCDKCGKSFEAHSSKNVEYERESCICPHCGHSICFTVSSCYNPKEQYALDEVCQGYSKVLTDKGMALEPTFTVFETVVFEDKRYFIVRRFHLNLKNGSVDSVKLYRGLIIPENEEDNYATVYDNDLGDLTASSTENPFDWLEKHKYHVPNLAEYYLSEEAVPYAENMTGLRDILRAWCRLLSASMHYYSKKCVEMREFLSKYPVDPMPEEPEVGKCYFEDHGKYCVFRKYKEYGDNIVEAKRWVFSLKTGYSKLLVFLNDEWEMNDDFSYYGFKDADVLEVRGQLEKTDIGKMGLFEYLAYTDRADHGSISAYHYLTTLCDVPVVETLAKIGMCYLIPDISAEKIRIYPSQKHLWSKLGLSRENFEFAKKERLCGSDFQHLLSINKYDANVDQEAFFRWVNEYAKADIYSIGIIVDNIGVTLKQIIDYLESVYYDQGCECEEAIVQWRDYLRNYETFYNHSPKSNEEKFPDSLKKAHDLMSMRNTKWAYEFNGVGKKYAEVVEKWKVLEFEDDSFKMIVPQTPKDISQEGARQHHCVAGYIKDILDGKCLILFLRCKDRVDRSFLTLEYDLDKHIRQIKGKFNMSLYEMTDAKQEKALLAFLRAWSAKTGIDTGIPELKGAA